MGPMERLPRFAMGTLAALPFAALALAQPPQLEMTPASEQELAAVGAAFRNCLDTPLRPMQGFLPGGETMVVTMQPVEESDERRLQYVGFARFDADTGAWAPSMIMLVGEQELADGSSVEFSGMLESGEVDEIHALLQEFWRVNAGVNDFRLRSVSGNRMPSLACETAEGSVLPEPAVVRYQAQVESVAAAAGQRPRDTRQDYFSSGSSVGEFVFWLERDPATQALAIREVECEGNERACNGAVLTALREAIAEPVDPAEVEGRLLALRQAVPPQYALTDDPQNLFRFFTAGREFLHASVEQLRLSPNRTGRGMINCSRTFEAGAEWECNFSLTGVVQDLPGRSFDVSLRDDGLDEAEVLRLVARAEAELEEWDGEIRTASLSKEEDGFSVQLYHAFRPVRMSFDEELNLLSLDFGSDIRQQGQ